MLLTTLPRPPSYTGPVAPDNRALADDFLPRAHVSTIAPNAEGGFFAVRWLPTCMGHGTGVTEDAAALATIDNLIEQGRFGS